MNEGSKCVTKLREDGLQQIGLSLRGFCYLTLFAEPQGVVLSEGSLNSILLCPMFGASLVNESLGKGKDRLSDKHFDYILKLKHGVFHANQDLLYRRNLIVTI